MFAFLRAVHSNPLDPNYQTLDSSILNEKRRIQFLYSVVYDFGQQTGLLSLPCVKGEDVPSFPMTVSEIKKVLVEDAKRPGEELTITIKEGLGFQDVAKLMNEDLKDVPRNEKAGMFIRMAECLNPLSHEA